MFHLKLHLRFHFNKHKKLQKNAKEKIFLVLQWIVQLTMQCKNTSLTLKLGSLRVLYIIYSVEQTELLPFSH